MGMDAEEYKAWLNDLLLHGTAITLDGKRVAREDWFFTEPPNYTWGGENLKVPTPNDIIQTALAKDKITAMRAKE